MQTQQNQSWVEGLTYAEGEQCLSTLQTLAGHLDTAMNAIVQQKLTSLHDSIHLQQVSCRRLADLRHRSRDRRSRSTSAETVDADLANEIKAATESVLVLNDRYAALLNHSGETLQLLAGFYRSYSSFAQPVSGKQPGLPSWSCEV